MSENITNKTVISGAEFREFCVNHWPENYYHEDEEFEFKDDEGQFNLPDDAKVILGECGFMVWDGPNGNPHLKGTVFPFVKFYQEYVRKLTTALVVVEMPFDKKEEILRYLEDLGCTVKSGKTDDNTTAVLSPQ